MIGDRDLLAFRQGYYDLLVSLLWKEPQGNLLVALRQGIQDRTKGSQAIHPLLGEGWAEITQLLDSVALERLAETVADEYTRLFIGPHSPEIHPYESYYLTGRLLDRPLVVIRSFLGEVGIEKDGGYAEPEDCLAFELEVMRRLVGRQGSAGDPDEEARWITHQAAFLKQHLLVWGPAAAGDLAGAKGAAFYRGLAKILQGFLEFERDLFKDWGPEPIQSLEEARRRLSGRGDWKGPTFDLIEPPPENLAKPDL
jgi:TorA maturation chaperone TorD